jgi:hypothetical protein
METQMQSRTIVIAAFALALAGSTGIADAGILSATARYEDGKLVVQGKTEKPQEYVELNSFVIKRSNRLGEFTFEQTRLPNSCTLHLRSGGKTTDVTIENCPLPQKSGQR